MHSFVAVKTVSQSKINKRDKCYQSVLSIQRERLYKVILKSSYNGADIHCTEVPLQGKMLHRYFMSGVNKYISALRKYFQASSYVLNWLSFLLQIISMRQILITVIYNKRYMKLQCWIHVRHTKHEMSLYLLAYFHCI